MWRLDSETGESSLKPVPRVEPQREVVLLRVQERSHGSARAP